MACDKVTGLFKEASTKPMAEDDPELWHAIHRLATALETLHTDSDFLKVGISFKKVDPNWGKDNAHDEGKPYVITRQNGKTLTEKLALQANLKELLKDAEINIKHWHHDYDAYVKEITEAEKAKVAQAKADEVKRKAEAVAQAARDRAEKAKQRLNRR